MNANTRLIDMTVEDLECVITGIVRDAISEIREQVKELEDVVGKGSDGDDVLSIDEASSLTGLSKAYIYKLKHKREIPCSKGGKKLYFSRKELTEWMMKDKVRTIRELETEAVRRISKYGRA